MQFHLSVSEEHECWRSNRGLGQIKNLHPLAHWHRGSVKIDMFQEAIHLAGGDSLAAFAGDFLERGKNLVHTLALGG